MILVPSGLGFTPRKGPAGGGSSPAPFSPTDISDLALWLKANDATTITASGGSVSQWDDKVAGNSGFEQPSSFEQPETGTRTQNSLNVLDFDGSDVLAAVDVSEYASIPGGNNTVFFFCNLDLTGEQRLFSGGSGSSSRWAILYNRISGTVEFNSSNAFSPVSVSITPSTGTHLFIMVRDGTSITGYVRGASGNATNTGSGGADFTGMNTFRIGAQPTGTFNYMDGAIGEVAAYGKALVTSEINDFIGYINSEWGTSFTTV